MDLELWTRKALECSEFKELCGNTENDDSQMVEAWPGVSERGVLSPSSTLWLFT